MIPSEFDYVLADSVEHAITELASDPEAKLLAGGHSLIPIMNCLLYTSPSPRDRTRSRMPSSA